MNAGAGLLDSVYVGVMLGSGVLLAILWRMLPGLLREEVTRTDIPIEPHFGQHARPIPEPMSFSRGHNGTASRVESADAKRENDPALAIGLPEPSVNDCSAA